MDLICATLINRLSVKSVILLSGTVLELSLFAAIWLAALLTNEPRMVLFFALAAQGLVAASVLLLRSWLKDAAHQRRHEEVISSTLRRNPV